MLSIDQASNRERAAAGAIRLLSKTLLKDLNQAAKDRIVPLAIDAATARASNPVMRGIVAKGRYSVWRGIPGVAFGGNTSATRTGVPGKVLVRGLEYGAQGRTEAIFQRKTPTGKTITTARHTTRQFMPDRTSNPTTVTPAMEAIADEALTIWVELVEAAVIQAFGEG